jgi:hypothetical protein
VVGDLVSALGWRETRPRDNQKTRERNRQTKETTRARGSIAAEKSVVRPKEIAIQVAKTESSEIATQRRGMSRQTLTKFETGAREERGRENESERDPKDFPKAIASSISTSPRN